MPDRLIGRTRDSDSWSRGSSPLWAAKKGKKMKEFIVRFCYDSLKTEPYHPILHKTDQTDQFNDYVTHLFVVETEDLLFALGRKNKWVIDKYLGGYVQSLTEDEFAQLALKG